MKNFPEKIPEGIRFTFKKGERLCSKKQIEKLFSEGVSFLAYPLKVVYVPTDFSGSFPARVAFAVPAKKFRKATERNLIKRRMREAYRLNKYLLHSTGLHSSRVVMFIYIGKEMLDFHSIEKAVKRSLSLIIKNTTAPNP